MTRLTGQPFRGVVNDVTPLPAQGMARQESPTVGLIRALLSYLTSSDIGPGRRLPGERALSEAFGVGRAQLREAIKSLILLGVLEQRVGDGTYVTRDPASLLPDVIEWGLLLGRNQLSDLIEARQLLEVMLAPQAARNRTEEQAQRMASLIAEMRDAAHDYDRYIQADVQFHMELAAASGNEVLTNVLRNIRSLVHVWAKKVISAAQETESSLAMHVPVLDAVVAGDPAAAQEAMQALMNRASRRLRDALDGEVAAIEAAR